MSERGNRRLLTARRAAAGLLGIWLASGTGVAAAEQAWVGGEVRLNLRAGPGTQYRILDVAQTGDAVTILERGEGWTKVSGTDGKEGWIPAGYLSSEPPAQVRLARLTQELEELRSRVEKLTREAAELRAQNQELTARDEEQRASIRELTEENLHLKAGERWPYLIAGASILAGGMLLGALLRASSGRRQPRIRF